MHGNTAVLPWPSDKPQTLPVVVTAVTGLIANRYFIYAYTLKKECMTTIPQTISNLQTAIRVAIRAISKEKLGIAIENLAYRLHIYPQSQIAYLLHIFYPQWNKVFLLQTWN